MTDGWNDYATLRAALLDQPMSMPPALLPNSASHGTVLLEDLVEAEAVSVHEAPPAIGSGGGDLPMLSAKDIRLDRPPSRRGSADGPGAVTVHTGDVAVVVGVGAAVRVCAEDGVLLGPGIHLVRGNPDTFDPRFLACVLRSAVDVADGLPFDLYRVEVPRIPLAEQDCYGTAFEQLIELESSWRRRRASIEQVVRAGIGGLAAGVLRPSPAE
ncbi:hypothetical protein SAMN04244553_3804 [Nocardia amikacinitolerans]|uniref:Type I restriction modification DNA specificity domain-containing protein n=1 Tax=Nocardia amikacinitolerans TaxID=756689 RepID=A0A285LMA6_9NOCA|nr:hypothetical protein [Nocardia amikacinitolerans]SNY86094.1 hypothetical protein SAMN04244553_3804 [Nocardia amikacinitolerans]